jgi:hypothetical protein
MRRASLCILIAVLLIVGVIVVIFVRHSPASEQTEIAAALLEYHQQFATNSYNSIGTYLPPSLYERYGDRSSSSSAETNYALVEYNYRHFGIDCGRMFTIRRPRADERVWTLTSSIRIRLPLWGWIGWRQPEISVTNSL